MLLCYIKRAEEKDVKLVLIVKMLFLCPSKLYDGRREMKKERKCERRQTDGMGVEE